MTIEQLKKANELQKQIDELEDITNSTENAYRIDVECNYANFTILYDENPQIFKMIKEYYEEKLKQAKEEFDRIQEDLL